ncbi:hypothetical protein [Umezawaea beigongshangensis]|uniref:hypothetical protein n=1 Tax=Umezawaea beigongshangensis TaxID=2780383 RepID=UPI0018F11ACE|nr:hypothetical protein [Umezawaea beigongshangensis]
MPNVPSQEELRKAGEQAAAAARTPLLAALGAGDLAAKAVVEALNKAKSRFEERSEAAKNAPNEFAGLRDRLDPAELRKLVDAYTQSAMQLYGYLAEQGEQTLDKLRSQQQVKKAADDARELADDVLGKVTRRTRAVGEKVADATDDVTEKLAVTVEEVGGDVAHEVRSTARRAAPRKATATKKNTSTAGE